jgi:hypothetical protein
MPELTPSLVVNGMDWTRGTVSQYDSIAALNNDSSYSWDEFFPYVPLRPCTSLNLTLTHMKLHEARGALLPALERDKG